MTVYSLHLAPPLPPIYISSINVWRSQSFAAEGQLPLNIHEQRQLGPCPLGFLIKLETPGTIESAAHVKRATLDVHIREERCRVEQLKLSFSLS